MNATVQSKPKLPGFINLLFVIVLGISLAKLMWLVLTPEKKINFQVEASGHVENIQKTKINYGKLIANQHLFGEIKKAPVVVTKAPSTPKEKVVVATKLNLKLHGIVAYKSKDGFALISSSNGPQKVYAKGDELEKGVSVRKIFPDKVILDNHGKTEELTLPVNQVSTSSNRSGFTAPRISGPNGLNQRRDIPPPAMNIGGMPDLANFRQEVLANPSKLMDIATPSPAIVDGQFIGFRVQPGTQRKLFRKLGFRPNDIITEVNGIVIDDASKGAMVLGELSQAAELSVKVKRGNREISIQHSF